MLGRGGHAIDDLLVLLRLLLRLTGRCLQLKRLRLLRLLVLLLLGALQQLRRLRAGLDLVGRRVLLILLLLLQHLLLFLLLLLLHVLDNRIRLQYLLRSVIDLLRVLEGGRLLLMLHVLLLLLL